MNLVKSIYLSSRFFQAVILLVLFFILGYIFSWLYPLAVGMAILFLVSVLLEFYVLFITKFKVKANRITPKKMSNGDYNDIQLFIRNDYRFDVKAQVIDEIPYQFQYRQSNWIRKIPGKSEDLLYYQLRPVKRGEYNFGKINIYISSLFHLIQRKFTEGKAEMVPVYPSIIQMKKYEYVAISNRLHEFGVKKIRRLGHTMEFEQIRNYTQGDDPRTINWKASARSNKLMINNYQDEKSQTVYFIIDKGRMMRFPFGGLSLLDYAINASLIMANIALKKEDKAGIITFSNKLSSIVPAAKKSDQLQKILEVLYNQKTQYKESNFELLSQYINKHIRQRSLMITFTNFESLSSFHRQLPYFIQLKKLHTIVIVFFKNRELSAFISKGQNTMEQIYSQTVAEEYEADKYLITIELKKYGIYSILTYPEDLNISVINTYLELKARGVV